MTVNTKLVKILDGIYKDFWTTQQTINIDVATKNDRYTGQTQRTIFEAAFKAENPDQANTFFFWDIDFFIEKLTADQLEILTIKNDDTFIELYNDKGEVEEIALTRLAII